MHGVMAVPSLSIVMPSRFISESATAAPPLTVLQSRSAPLSV